MLRRLPLLFLLALIAVIGTLSAAAADALTAAPAPRTAVKAGSPASGPAAPVVPLNGPRGGPSLRVTMPPVGLSIEYPIMAQDLGTGACPSPGLAAELLRLGSPPLRLGGDSQDLTAPTGALSTPSSSWETATMYSLPTGFWTRLRCLLVAAKDPLTVGVNAKTGQLSWAQQMVAGAQSAAVNGLDFSIGNEPDLYTLPNYASLGKHPVNEPAAVNAYLQVATYLRQAVGSAALIGPDLAGADHWRRMFPRVIAQLHEQIVGVHMYPLTTCGNPDEATINGLLSAFAANAPRRQAWVVRDADAAHVPAIISEANSASCGGREGVSDSPAAAVWATRFTLSALLTGFREVRFHLSGGAYDPFVVRGGRVIDQPLDSALVALNRWLPVGSSLQSVNSGDGLLTTAISGPMPGARLIFDNRRAKAQQTVVGAVGNVTVQRLSPAQAGVITETRSSTRGRLKLTVPANSVIAVLAR